MPQRAPPAGSHREGGRREGGLRQQGTLRLQLTACATRTCRTQIPHIRPDRRRVVILDNAFAFELLSPEDRQKGMKPHLYQGQIEPADLALADERGALL